MPCGPRIHGNCRTMAGVLKIPIGLPASGWDSSSFSDCHLSPATFGRWIGGRAKLITQIKNDNQQHNHCPVCGPRSQGNSCPNPGGGRTRRSASRPEACRGNGRTGCGDLAARKRRGQQPRIVERQSLTAESSTNSSVAWGGQNRPIFFIRASTTPAHFPPLPGLQNGYQPQ